MKKIMPSRPADQSNPSGPNPPMKAKGGKVTKVAAKTKAGKKR